MSRTSCGLIVAFLTVMGCARDEPEAEPGSAVVTQQEEGHAEVDGGRLFYKAMGSGDAIVLIHGNAGDHRHWNAQMELAGELRVVRYDLRGFGKSSLPVEGQPYSHAEDLAALLDHLGIEKAHVAGWSMGSGIAVDFALAFPERTRSLISVGPWVFGHNSPAAQDLFSNIGLVASALESGGQPAAVEAWMTMPFFASTITDPRAGEEFHRIASDYTFWAMNHQDPGRIVQPPAIDRTSEIQVPTLIMTAEREIPACYEIADLLKATVANSLMVEMAGTGHLLHMEQPGEFNRHLREFLNGLAAEG